MAKQRIIRKKIGRPSGKGNAPDGRTKPSRQWIRRLSEVHVHAVENSQANADFEKNKAEQDEYYQGLAFDNPVRADQGPAKMEFYYGRPDSSR